MLAREGTTQGDNMATAFYAIGMNPLMDKLERNNLIQEWFADAAAALEELISVQNWWDQLNHLGRNLKFFPKASNFRLIAETEELAIKANVVFATSNINNFWRKRTSRDCNWKYPST